MTSSHYRGPAPNRSKRGETPPHRRRGAAATKQNTKRRENTRSEQHSTRGGLVASAVGFLSCTGSPLPPRRSRSGHVSKIVAKVVSRGAPPPKALNSLKPPMNTEFLSLLLRARGSCVLVSRPRMSPAPSADDVSHRVAPAKLKRPATIRCNPSRPPLSLPQAPS
jgi:hypothetical protein